MIWNKKYAKKTAAVLAALAVAAGLAGCGTDAGTGSSHAKGKNVTLAMVSTWSSASPVAGLGNYSALVMEQVYDKLWTDQFDGSVKPRLAESYEVSPDHDFMTVHLNPKAKFTDGVPVTADDVVFSAQLVTRPDIRAANRTDFHYVKGTTDSGVVNDPSQFGFEKVDDHTIKITFKHPMNELPILQNLNRYFFIVPKHIYGDKTADELNNADTWKQNVVGSGPFKFVSAVDGERVEYERNPDYFLGAPDVEKLTVRVVPSNLMLAGLQSGEIDVLAGAGIGCLPVQDFETAKEDNHLKVLSVPNYGYQCMIFNVQSPKLPNALVRRGISTAINRKAIVDNLIEGHGSVNYTRFPGNHPFVDESKLHDLPEYNPEKAKQLLQEGGYDFDQTLELVVPTGNEVRVQSTVLIQQDLEAVGVKTNITQYDFTTEMDKMRNGEFDLGMMGAAGSINPSVPEFMMPGAKSNFTTTPDDRYSKLFDDASRVVDLDQEKAAFNDVWQKLVDDSPIAYLYSVDSLVAYNKDRLSNVDPSVFEQVNWDVASWKVKEN